jgi:hypothetical protein
MRPRTLPHIIVQQILRQESAQNCSTLRSRAGPGLPLSRLAKNCTHACIHVEPSVIATGQHGSSPSKIGCAILNTNLFVVEQTGKNPTC